MVRSRKSQGLKISFYGVVLFLSFILCRSFCFADEAQNFKVGGYYLGLLNAIQQNNRTVADAKRSQFDFAVNLVGEWKISPKISGSVELQGGTGGGSLGLAGPGVIVQDLYLQLTPKTNFILTVGSFNNPFGEEVESLTSNAASFDNPFVLNSLFYSAFGGTVGTLNTLGVKGNYKTDVGDVTFAVSNGTDESAANADGNFEFLASAGTSRFSKRLRLAGSYMKSNDRGPAGIVTGFGANFNAWMLESRYDFPKGTYLKGYYGNAAYGDDNPSTKDNVKMWMAEAKYSKSLWYVSARLSCWEPDDNNGNGAGVSSVLPNPGLAIAQGGVTPVADQNVRRLQIGAGWSFLDNLMLKAEWFQDKYSRLSSGKSTDVNGFIVALNGRF